MTVQQVELCRHLQSQLSSLREEHQGALSQLKEAHALLERHVETSTRASHNEVGILADRLMAIYFIWESRKN